MVYATTKRRQYNGYTRRRKFKSKYAKLNPRTGGSIGQELMFRDQSDDAVTVPSTTTLMVIDEPASGCLNGMSQGSGESERVGMRVVNKRLDINVNWNQDGTTSQVLRLLVVQDTQTNGTMMTGDAFMPDKVSGLLDQNLNFANPFNSHRFKILYDKTFQGTQPSRYWNGSAEVSPEGTKFIKIRLKLGGKKGIVTRYTTTGNTVSAIADNSFHLLAVADQSAGSDTLSWFSRLRYYSV